MRVNSNVPVADEVRARVAGYSRALVITLEPGHERTPHCIVGDTVAFFIEFRERTTSEDASRFVFRADEGGARALGEALLAVASEIRSGRTRRRGTKATP